MDHVIPINWLNKILFLSSITCASLCIIIEQWLSLTSLPIYVPLIWSSIVITVSTWLSCIVLKTTLKATAPLNIASLTSWLQKRLGISQKSQQSVNPPSDASTKDPRTDLIHRLTSEIDEKYIAPWYDNITDDRTFRTESKDLLTKLFTKFSDKLSSINEVRLFHKLTDILLLHLKEYRRSLRRVDKKTAKNMDEAYRCSHPGSRSAVALEHTLHRMVTLLSREFLQWELTSSLPCKLLLSILAKRLLLTIKQFSEPKTLFKYLLKLLKAEKRVKKNGIVSKALSRGIASATAPIVPRKFPEMPPELTVTEPIADEKRLDLPLDGLSSPQKGLWAEADDLDEDDGISPVYEEPTDFATTIARLRSLLQEKSTATSPLNVEEKTYVDNQFTNLMIPWTEFYTAADGSQQLLYCIQFDDIEQHGEDLFETTTATTRRQYSDFVQLHANLEEVQEYASVLGDVKLPDGGRVEMENYLRTLCARLGDGSVQLRHFLRPSSGSGKKADAVAPRFDRFLAKTVTGVFNTLRTVVPGFELEEEELPLPTLMPLADIPWRFVEDVKNRNRSLTDELKQIVAERSDYCAVDTAYEAADTVEGSGDSELLAHWWETANCPYDEELDEIDAKLMMTCSMLDILCEILGGIKSTNTIRQEAVIRWIKLFCGNFIEESIHDWIKGIFGVFEGDYEDEGDEEEGGNVEEKLVEMVGGKVCGDLRIIFGEWEIKRMVRFFVKSFGSGRINLDLWLQILDAGASEVLAIGREGKSDR